MRRRLLIVLAVAAIAAGVPIALRSPGDDRLSKREAEAKGRDMLKSCLAPGSPQATPVVRCERRDEDWSCSYATAGRRGELSVPDQDDEVSIIC